MLIQKNSPPPQFSLGVDRKYGVHGLEDYYAMLMPPAQQCQLARVITYVLQYVASCAVGFRWLN